LAQLWSSADSRRWGCFYVLFKNIYPVPPSPYEVLPRIFLALMVVTGLWYTVVRSRKGAPIDLTDRVTEEDTDQASLVHAQAAPH